MIESWVPVTTREEVLEINRQSIQNPDRCFVVIKNSTRCGASRMAVKAFESAWSFSLPVYLLQVVEHRDASDEVTSVFGVRHESPQLLLIRNGHVIHHASHSAIDALDVMDIIGKELR